MKSSSQQRSCVQWYLACSLAKVAMAVPHPAHVCAENFLPSASWQERVNLRLAQQVLLPAEPLKCTYAYWQAAFLVLHSALAISRASVPGYLFIRWSSWCKCCK